MFRKKFFQMPNLLLLVSGAFSTILGTIVLVGWFTHTRQLITVIPSLPSMQFNTALMFVCCGLGFLSIPIKPFRRPLFSRVLGVLAVCVGLATLFEHFLGINLGIDQLLMVDFVNLSAARLMIPGRMAPITALLVTLTGISLLLMSLERPSRHRSLLLGIVGSAVLAAGQSVFVGYMFGSITVFGWGLLTRMAVHTSLGFIMIGCAIVAFAWKDGRSKQSDSPRWLPLLAAIPILMMTLGLWQSLRIADQSHIEQTVKLEQENAGNRISQEIQTRARALGRMAKRWGIRGQTPESEWSADALAYVNDYGGYQAIEWVDPTFHTRYLIDAAGDRTLAGHDYSTEPEQASLMEQSRDRRQTTLIGVTEKSSGSRLIQISVPIFHANEFSGFIVGLIRVKPFVDGVLDPQLARDFYLTVFEGPKEIYSSADMDNQTLQYGPQPTKIDSNGLNWQLRMWPRPATLISHRSNLDSAALTVGLLFTLLLSISISLGQTARARAKETERGNEQLLIQAAQKRLAESALRESENRYRNSVEHGLGLMCVHDLDGAIQFVNRAAADLFGYEPEQMIGLNLMFATPPHLRARMNDYIAEIRKNGTASGIWTILTRQGETRTLMYRNAVKEEPGRPPYVVGHAQDITELKHAHKMVAEANNNLNALLDAATEVSIISSDQSGLITTFNSGAERMLGYRAEEMVGKSTAAIIHYEPEVLEYGRQLSLEFGKTIDGIDVFRERARREGHEVREWTYVHKDGSHLTVNLAITAVKNSSGEIRGFLGIATDITKRKKAELGQARLSSVLEETSDFVGTAGLDGRSQYINRAGRRIIGLRDNQDVSEFMISEFHPEWSARLIQSEGIPAAIRDGIWSGETAFLHRDGHEIPVIQVIIAHKSADGEVEFLSTIAHDITERKRIEDERAQLTREQKARIEAEAAEKRYRYLAESIPQIVWTANPDGELDYYNQRWHDYTGMTLEQTQGWGWKPVLHPDDLQECIDRWSESIKSGDIYQTEYRFKRASDGEYRWHLGRALPLRDENGQITKWFGTCTDIHDQKQAEDEIRKLSEDLEKRVAERTLELQRSNKDLEQFAYVASHDLQEPLRMVGSYTQLLAKRYQGQIDEKADKYIHYAVDGVNRMQHLINDLLAYARVGTKADDLTPVNFSVVLERVLFDLKVAIAESGAVITAGELPIAIGDESKLCQVFQNLIGNAIKFRRPGVSPEIYISAEEKDAEWLFTFRDNGIGIRPEFAERIFVIFQRLHKRDEYEGTGIGLSICKRIIERLGGRIWVDSEIGKGTTFQFTIPILGESNELQKIGKTDRDSIGR